MDPNTIIPIISVLSASASPVVLTILNHRHEAKMKNIEAKNAIHQATKIEELKNKTKAFENLFNAAGDFISSFAGGDMYIYYGNIVKAAGIASLHCLPESQNSIEALMCSAEFLYASYNSDTSSKEENAKLYDGFVISLNKLRHQLSAELTNG